MYDTASQEVRPVELREPGRVSMYVCGPTVYGDPHVGHGRFTVTWDVIRRYLEWSGLEVRYVSNITDIDDKIIARANEEGVGTDDVVKRYERVWWDTMGRLGVSAPNEEPHATRWIAEMVDLIAGLVDSGAAYVGGDGVYFASATVADYGLLAHQPLDSLRAGARVAVGEEAGKRSPTDFVLWKFAKAGEPSWPSPWGAGRPGWHTECVVMSLGLLGDGFDLHGGGSDLAFPHHENERAQAVAAGRVFARHWVHSGMVVTDGGEKMSKSLGNTLSLPELAARWDPRAFRLLVLGAHYRSPMTVSPTTLAASLEAVRGLDAFARRFAPAREVAPDAGALEAFRAAMDDDLDTPRAVAGVHGLVREANRGGPAADALAAAAIELLEVALGLPLARPDQVPAEVAALVDERAAARAARDWARSDALRDELSAMGWVVEDAADGAKLHRRDDA
ncbi:MAG TPA: cysteine--tRNA ligase [Acidimicrobiales bacterium]|nr:cysteine--tRNA ligase [Acidimicrobiales bacterium]